MDRAELVIEVCAEKNASVVEKVKQLIEVGIASTLGYSIFIRIENKVDPEILHSVKKSIVHPLREYEKNFEDLYFLIYYFARVFGENTAISTEINCVKQSMVQKLGGVVGPIEAEIATLEKIVSAVNITELTREALDGYFAEVRQCLKYMVKIIKEYLEGAV